jgi:hypothetical protein
MTILNKAVRYLFSLAMAIASVLAFAWTPGLIAARNVSGLEAMFLLNGSLLAALVFALRVKETGEHWPLSIMRADPVHPREFRPGRILLRRSEA